MLGWIWSNSYVPLASVVTVPILMNVPFALVHHNVTLTPGNGSSVISSIPSSSASCHILWGPTLPAAEGAELGLDEMLGT